MLRLTTIIPVLVLTAAPALAVDPAANAFVAGLYRTYETSETGLDISSRAKAARYFTPSTTALIIRDQNEAAKRGDVGRLGSDPFVDAQDWMPRKINIAVEDGPKPDRATARASFKPPGSQKRTAVELDLLRTAAGWRVSDIRWTGQAGSLRQILTRVDE